MPKSTLLYIYNWLVQPHFDYQSLVWVNCGKTSSNKLQKLQNCVPQVITLLGYDTNVPSLFHKLSWKDLQSLCQMQKALMVSTSGKSLVSQYLASRFAMQNESNNALRDSVNKIVVPFPKTNCMKNSFVTTVQPFGTDYPVTLESLVH